MKFFLATIVLLSSTTDAFVVAPTRSHAVRMFSASESDILEIVEKMPRLDAGEKASLKNLLYKAGDVHPNDNVADVVVGTEESTPEPVAVTDQAKEEILVTGESSSAETVEVKEETQIETTLVSEDPATDSTTGIAEGSPVAAESVTEADAPIQIAQGVIESAEQAETASQAIAGEDSNMLADLVVDVVNSSSELVDSVSTAISQLS